MQRVLQRALPKKVLAVELAREEAFLQELRGELVRHLEAAKVYPAKKRKKREKYSMINISI
jgi:hypothetical protein